LENAFAVVETGGKQYKVKAGEVIATVGNTGELTTGPHLHFELWHQGKALNPEYFIAFE